MRTPKILIVAIAIIVALIITGCYKQPTVSNKQLVIVTEGCEAAGMTVSVKRYWTGGIAEVSCVPPQDTVPEAPELRSVK